MNKRSLLLRTFPARDGHRQGPPPAVRINRVPANAITSMPQVSCPLVATVQRIALRPPASRGRRRIARPRRQTGGPVAQPSARRSLERHSGGRICTTP